MEFIPVLAWVFLSSSGGNWYNREWAWLGAVVEELWDLEGSGVHSLN